MPEMDSALNWTVDGLKRKGKDEVIAIRSWWSKGDTHLGSPGLPASKRRIAE